MRLILADIYTKTKIIYFLIIFFEYFLMSIINLEENPVFNHN